MRNTFAVILCASLLAIVALTVPCQAETICACIHKETGLTRIVKSASECKTAEKPVSWNTVGPQGPVGPAGPQGRMGPAGPAGGRSFTSSVVSNTEIEECTVGGLSSCLTKAQIGIRLSEQPITLEALDIKTLQQSGELQALQEIIHLEIAKELEILCDDGSTHRNCGGENDYHINIKIAKGETGTPFNVKVSPSSPLYNSETDNYCALHPTSCPVPIQARLNTDSLLTLGMDRVRLNVVTFESVGSILSA